MDVRLYVATLVAAVTLAGCATEPQRAIAYAMPTDTARHERVGVAMTALPKVETSLPGAACLLCIMTASIANTTLSAYTHALSSQDLPMLKMQVADRLRKNGVPVVLIDRDLNVSKLPKAHVKGPDLADKDYSAIGAQYHIDHLIVINIWQVGFERPYSAYFPSSDPKGAVTGAAYEVNLKTNAYEWFAPVAIRISAKGDWDQPPRFPALTDAYLQAIEMSKDIVLSPFSGQQ